MDSPLLVRCSCGTQKTEPFLLEAAIIPLPSASLFKVVHPKEMEGPQNIPIDFQEVQRTDQSLRKGRNHEIKSTIQAKGVWAVS